MVKCRGKCRTAYDDDNGHGTHVAGTVAAVNNSVGVLGVAPAAELWAVKVLSGSGSGSTSGIVQGINWVIGHNNGGKPKVINMSLGGSGTDDQDGQYCPSTRSTNAFHNVIQKAVCDYRITVVVAAGNEGDNAANHTPAAYDEVITVSATNSQDDWPSWSNYGPDVDLAAPPGFPSSPPGTPPPPATTPSAAPPWPAPMWPGLPPWCFPATPATPRPR